MSRSEGWSERNQSNGETSISGRFDAIRSTVKSLDPQDVERQLPNLVKAVVEKSSDPDTQMFVIGISSSKSDTLFDYRLERLVYDSDIEHNRLETLKPAVSSDHLYLTFPYPPDPNFTAESLRGAILTTIENQHSSRNGWRGVTQPDESSEETSRVVSFLRQIGLI